MFKFKECNNVKCKLKGNCSRFNAFEAEINLYEKINNLQGNCANFVNSKGYRIIINKSIKKINNV